MDQNVAFDEEQFFGGRRVKLGGRARDGVTETSSRSLKKSTLLLIAAYMPTC